MATLRHERPARDGHRYQGRRSAGAEIRPPSLRRTFRMHARPAARPSTMAARRRFNLTGVHFRRGPRRHARGKRTDLAASHAARPDM